VPIDAVVADANVLLAATSGRAALRVITALRVTVHVTEWSVAEIGEYLPYFARRYGISQEVIEIAWRLLPKTVHPFEDCSAQYAQAALDLAKRDPEDAHALALARSLRLPLWSNDKDLRGLGVRVYPTVELLAVLERSCS
jgi:predicted nucleic acid-binding protein